MANIVANVTGKSWKLSERLRDFRDAAGLSRSELSRLAGLARGHVRLLETNVDGDATLDTLRALSAVFGVSIDTFCGNGKLPTKKLLEAAVEQAREHLREKLAIQSHKVWTIHDP